jgi:lipopolysaccharide export LptBFGC system permease protein LptF
LALVLFSLGITAAKRSIHGWVAMIAAALTASFGYYVLLFYARESVLHSDWLPSEVAAWLPNLVFLTMALLLFRRPAVAETQVSHR